MNWMEYVDRIASGETKATIAAKLGVSGPTVSRWNTFGPRPDNVSAFARAYNRPVLEAFVAAGYITPDEANEQPAAAPSLTSLSNDELVSELARRLKAGEGDASTPLTRAGVSPAPEDDGLGSFGGRARGDLDHESINDGAGENVHPLRPDLDNMAAYRTGKETEKQRLLREEAERENESQDPDDWE